MLTPRPPHSAATLFLVCLTLRGSCGLAQVPSPLQVNQAEYLATCTGDKGETCSYGFTLIARYENRTADSLYLDRCGPRDRTPMYGVEAINDTTEGAAYDHVWACTGHDFPIVVAPHAVRVDTLRIEGPNSYDGKTNAPLGKFEGQFRLIYTVGPCWLGRPKCRIVPGPQRSQTFRVRLVR